MHKLPDKYFQKSKVFLYPLLGFKRGLEFIPINTYICWDNQISKKDYKLICVYNTENTLEFLNFLNKHLKTNSLYQDHMDSESKQICIFNIFIFKEEFNNFIDGYYSKFSRNSKNTILKYFNGTKSYINIDAYLNPDKYHEHYADFFNEDINIIRKVYETCDKPDIEKETLYL